MATVSLSKIGMSLLLRRCMAVHLPVVFSPAYRRSCSRIVEPRASWRRFFPGRPILPPFAGNGDRIVKSKELYVALKDEIDNLIEAKRAELDKEEAESKVALDRRTPSATSTP